MGRVKDLLIEQMEAAPDPYAEDLLPYDPDGDAAAYFERERDANVVAMHERIEDLEQTAATLRDRVRLALDEQLADTVIDLEITVAKMKAILKTLE